MSNWKLWRHKSGLILYGGREVEVEVWVHPVAAKWLSEFREKGKADAAWRCAIRIPKNTAYETENRPPKLSTPGGTIPARALLELYEEVK